MQNGKERNDNNLPKGYSGDVSYTHSLVITLIMENVIVKNLPAMGKTWVRSLGWDDPSEEGMATHSSIVARRIP